MKPLAFLVPLLLAFSAVASEPAPALGAKAAVDIAEKSLATRGLAPKVFIQALTLQSTSLVGGKRTWFVQWAGFVEGAKAGTREVGLEIDMSGKVVRVVKEPGAAQSGPKIR